MNKENQNPIEMVRKRFIDMYKDINHFIENEEKEEVQEYIEALIFFSKSLCEAYNNPISGITIIEKRTKDTICNELNNIISKYGDDSLDMIKCYLHHLEKGTSDDVK